MDPEWEGLNTCCRCTRSCPLIFSFKHEFVPDHYTDGTQSVRVWTCPTCTAETAEINLGEMPGVRQALRGGAEAFVQRRKMFKRISHAHVNGDMEAISLQMLVSEAIEPSERNPTTTVAIEWASKGGPVGSSIGPPPTRNEAAYQEGEEKRNAEKQRIRAYMEEHSKRWVIHQQRKEANQVLKMAAKCMQQRVGALKTVMATAFLKDLLSHGTYQELLTYAGEPNQATLQDMANHAKLGYDLNKAAIALRNTYICAPPRTTGQACCHGGGRMGCHLVQ